MTSPPPLSVCCFAGKPLEMAAVVLAQLRDAADEIVCAVDASIAEEEAAVLEPVVDKLVRAEFDRTAGVERNLSWLHSLCSGRWVLRIDSDEVVSSALRDELPDLVRQRDVKQYLLARRWLWPDAHRWIEDAPWGNDWQNRLVRNDPGLLRFSGEIHSSAELVAPYRYVEAPLYHLDCVISPPEARRAKASRYEAQRPGHITERGFPVNGYYVPEYHGVERLGPVPEEDWAAIDDAIHPCRAAKVFVGEPPPSARQEIPLVAFADIDRHWARRPLAASAYHARVEVLEPIATLGAGRQMNVPVRVHNTGSETWPWGSFPPFVRLGCRWAPRHNLTTVIEGGRTPFSADIRPGEAAVQMFNLQAPTSPGDYVLIIDVVHEHVRWFGSGGLIDVTVVP